MFLFLIYSSALLLSFVSLMHFYWVLGGKVGIQTAVPEKASGGATFTPSKFATLFVAVGLLVVAFILLVQYNLIPFMEPNTFTKWVCIVFTFVFGIRSIGDFQYLGFFKRIKHSTFAKYDTFIYSPLCLYLAVAFFIASWGRFS
ncbi:DUF3995 domain-containing protein [Evansella sp. AB-P1]|uniref:DUF3995 domain-containing protein n=1 Tax=Evansella sp. AB-P1 TaxID=3037653 RepID=UPI00241F0196|nr:DUF3995 domain-containing protein [Evansella sp. AB-P1]MDG5788814.1 DUF3995 domain-containing protein [Evansella sp. AB-P1]